MPAGGVAVGSGQDALGDVAQSQPSRNPRRFTTFANNLRGLTDALTAFDNYRPGAFLDEQVVAEVADTRRRRRRGVGDDQ